MPLSLTALPAGRLAYTHLQDAQNGKVGDARLELAASAPQMPPSTKLT